MLRSNRTTPSPPPSTATPAPSPTEVSPEAESEDELPIPPLRSYGGILGNGDGQAFEDEIARIVASYNHLERDRCGFQNSYSASPRHSSPSCKRSRIYPSHVATSSARRYTTPRLLRLSSLRRLITLTTSRFLRVRPSLIASRLSSERTSTARFFRAAFGFATAAGAFSTSTSSMSCSRTTPMPAR